MSECACYSVRQLSPFVGSIQIVEDSVCRALSSDGVHWQIQASCETHQTIWKISDEAYTPRRYVLYGSWSAEHGFSHLPLDPMLDVPSPAHVQQHLISQLQAHSCSLPFAPLDVYECWLMRNPQTPLALLASTTHEHIIPHIQTGRWQAIPQQDYSSSSLDDEFREHMRQLENDINQDAQLAWFYRTDTPQARSLTDGFSDLDAQQFPHLLLNPDALSTASRPFYDELIDWLSPRLLGLPKLTEEVRASVQSLAQHHALETYRRLAIYPAPLPAEIMNKIQVELKIRGL